MRLLEWRFCPPDPFSRMTFDALDCGPRYSDADCVNKPTHPIHPPKETDGSILGFRKIHIISFVSSKGDCLESPAGVRMRLMALGSR